MGQCNAMSTGLVILVLVHYKAYEPCAPASGDGDVWWRAGGKEGSGATQSSNTR